MEKHIPSFHNFIMDRPTGGDYKPLSSFLSSNVERDADGAFRIPSEFLDKFGHELNYHVYIGCGKMLWFARYDKERKKICRLYDFMRYYGLKLYSVMLFDYFGNGCFIVSCYNSFANQIVHPAIEPLEFFEREKSYILKNDEFICGNNNLEMEKYIARVTLIGLRNDPFDFRIEIDGGNDSESHNLLRLPKDMEDLYSNWKGKEKISLSLAKTEWEVEIKWIEDSCLFGKGWYNLIKELDISKGDVVALMTTTKPDLVSMCMFKHSESIAEQDEGKLNENHSFYKVLIGESFLKGNIVLPMFVDEIIQKLVRTTQQMVIGKKVWNIKYAENYRILYGLSSVIQHFQLNEYDAVIFSFEEDGLLTGRLYRNDGMEIDYSNPSRNTPSLAADGCFLFEVSCEGSKMDMVVNEEEETEMDKLIETEMTAVIEIVENNAVDQFSQRMLDCNLNGRCHGMHIPLNMKFHNRDWEKGDAVKFRTNRGTWDIGIVLNNGKARFSAGWSRFVREQKLKKSDNLLFTLREEEDKPIFDIEVNP